MVLRRNDYRTRGSVGTKAVELNKLRRYLQLVSKDSFPAVYVRDGRIGSFGLLDAELHKGLNYRFRFYSTQIVHDAMEKEI
jgi:hypothetical protein